MPAPGEYKKRKKLKNPIKWLKEKIVDPLLEKLRPLVRTFLKSKFGSSLSKFVTWVNQSVIQQDKFGLMNAIKSVVPGGVYLDQALKIAGNLIEKADYDAIGRFVEALVFNSDKQEETIASYGKTLEDTLRSKTNTLRTNTPANPVRRQVQAAFKTQMTSQPPPQTYSQPIEDSDDDDDDQRSTRQSSLSAAERVFGKPIN